MFDHRTVKHAGIRVNTLKPVLVAALRTGPMPRKGYRKGIDDGKEAVPHFVRTRLSLRLHTTLLEDAARRRTTRSKLLRAILAKHYEGPALPRVPAGKDKLSLIRELNRIGVNLNQLAHVGNATNDVPVDRLKTVLSHLQRALEKV